MTKINKMYVVHYEFVQIAAGMVNNDLSTLINETEKPCVFRVIKRKKEKKNIENENSMLQRDNSAGT